ncbi:unnamed protein product [Mytilus coruscus]|uniref:Uncharacterized protein n=1 Tax=Mytilus coruscus TaxID=42192 RepID=A0A6J8F3Z7_MYTCO|nr:unnamed protein product [Mytilus coruscus]
MQEDIFLKPELLVGKCFIHTWTDNGQDEQWKGRIYSFDGGVFKVQYNDKDGNDQQSELYELTCEEMKTDFTAGYFVFGGIMFNLSTMSHDMPYPSSQVEDKRQRTNSEKSFESDTDSESEQSDYNSREKDEMSKPSDLLPKVSLTDGDIVRIAETVKQLLKDDIEKTVERVDLTKTRDEIAFQARAYVRNHRLEATWVVDGKIMVIGKDNNKHAVTRMYDLNDHVFQSDNFTEINELEDNQESEMQYASNGHDRVSEQPASHVPV